MGGPSICDKLSPIFSGPPFDRGKKKTGPPYEREKNSGPPRSELKTAIHINKIVPINLHEIEYKVKMFDTDKCKEKYLT